MSFRRQFLSLFGSTLVHLAVFAGLLSYSPRKSVSPLGTPMSVAILPLDAQGTTPKVWRHSFLNKNTQKASLNKRALLSQKKDKENAQALKPTFKNDTESNERHSGSPAPGLDPTYISLIRHKIEKSLYYPLSFRQRRIQGEVIIQLTMDLEGKLHLCKLSKSSGYPELDALALQAVMDSSPFPPLQQNINYDQLIQAGKLTLNLPVQFNIDR